MEHLERMKLITDYRSIILAPLIGAGWAVDADSIEFRRDVREDCWVVHVLAVATSGRRMVTSMHINERGPGAALRTVEELLRRIGKTLHEWSPS